MSFITKHHHYPLPRKMGPPRARLAHAHRRGRRKRNKVGGTTARRHQCANRVERVWFMCLRSIVISARPRVPFFHNDFRVRIICYRTRKRNRVSMFFFFFVWQTNCERLMVGGKSITIARRRLCTHTHVCETSEKLASEVLKFCNFSPPLNGYSVIR